MKLIKKLFIVTIAAICLLSTTSCGSKFRTVDEIKENGTLVVATNAEFAPFEYVEGDKFLGIDIEIIKAYGEYLGVEVNIVDQEFDAALLSAETGKADLAIAGITRNPVREKTLGFSNAYYTANQVVIVKSDSKYASMTTADEILNALSSDKAKIGVQTNTTGQYYVEGDADWEFEGIKDTECLIYDNGPVAGQALAQGKIDAIIIDSAPADIIASKQTGLVVLPVVLTDEEYAIAVTKGNDSLIASLNEFIETIKKNGVFDQIVSKYF